ncbi:unnamed protein product [Adineta steineri]|uniref:Uncharacterized protein n=1 Tax=Adineta steineri TaxID=433720 RepID=A0A813XX88_9BILA|nr:unnamed protein product [Adineta steineri]CAF0871333.1 unnamed protein product [Adineta steineri]
MCTARSMNYFDKDASVDSGELLLKRFLQKYYAKRCVSLHAAGCTKDSDCCNGNTCLTYRNYILATSNPRDSRLRGDLPAGNYCFEL